MLHIDRDCESLFEILFISLVLNYNQFVTSVLNK